MYLSIVFINIASFFHMLLISSGEIPFSIAAFLSFSKCSENIWAEYLFHLKKKSAISQIIGIAQTNTSKPWYQSIFKQSCQGNHIWIHSAIK
jgi:hypothetical protein